MPDVTPDRLQEFRAQSQPRVRPVSLRFAALSGVIAALVTSVALLVGLPYVLGGGGRVRAGGLSAEQWRDYASYLADKGLNVEAVSAYNHYLARARLKPSERAKVCYSVAKLALAGEKYEQALAYLYEAERLDPKSDLKSDIDKKIILCLDKTGRTEELRRELKERTSPKRTAADVKTGETVVAKFDGEVITDRDLDQRISRLPEPVRESLDTPDKKLEYLKNLVAQKLLVDKAMRQELEKDPDVVKALAEDRDALVVRKLIENEVRAKVSITSGDVKRYYKAEIQRFTTPAAAEVKYAKADSEDAVKSATDFSHDSVTVTKGGTIPGVPDSPEAVKGIFSAAVGAKTTPVKIKGHWYIFQVVSKTPAKVSPFDDVKARAEKMLRAVKEQEEVQALIEDTLKSQDVRLYPDRLKKAEEKS